jgi:gliding motility-associated-like protein
MKKIIIVCAVLLTVSPWKWLGNGLFAQVMSNFGSVIYSANDTIFANGGITNDKENFGAPGGVGGTFQNSGQVYLSGDWTNNAGNTAFRNAANTNSISGYTCYMFGGNQNIQGTSITEFHNLVLEGTGVKQLNNINSIVHDTLNLNDRELATGPNNMWVTTTDPNAIERSTGFVSSLPNGYLKRSTASNARYLFPVGSSVGTPRFRPIEIAPDDNFPNDYAVRLANITSTTTTDEGFNVNTKNAAISSVNNMFYHQITRESGLSPASITMYYSPGIDGSVTGIGHWQNGPEWEDIRSDPDAGNYGLSASTKKSWDFTLPSPAFALMKLINECGEMFVPNAFSPDGNGENDMECVYGKCVQDIYFVIYDRWGEKVFETTNISKCWDGTFRGKEMNTAVFVYYMKAKLTTGEEVEKKGNISLFR